MGCLISSSITSNWTHTETPYSCSVESGLTELKRSIMKGGGFCLLYKRYENGRLQWPRTGEEAKQISEQQLRWLLEGLNPEQPKLFENGFRKSRRNSENP